eukprot:CAMPEP_0115829274 /NCGR_PEP_ID=MMETSP0287-20121206/1014_1 /TAXON_ID=412157 /ORGANISM="Chrysochromulina rotalis, Strain UIO044" /LENGTH=399 /DNA_ID=CAMNT_0003282535 /DNA_START=37 /DNA_END=1237 /DNA_ORIENTATION=+
MTPTSPVAADDEELNLLSPHGKLTYSPVEPSGRSLSTSPQSITVDCEALSPRTTPAPPALKSTPSSRQAAEELTDALRFFRRVNKQEDDEQTEAIKRAMTDKSTADEAAAEKAVIQRAAAQTAAEEEAAAEKPATGGDGYRFEGCGASCIEYEAIERASDSKRSTTRPSLVPSRMTTVQLRRALQEGNVAFSTSDAKSILIEKMQTFLETMSAERAVEERVAKKVSAHKAAAGEDGAERKLSLRHKLTLPVLRKQATSIYDDQLQMAFAIFDTDRTGGLSKRQLYAALAHVGLAFSLSEQLSIWKAFDRDSNGKIEFEEFRALGVALLDQGGSKTKPTAMPLTIKHAPNVMMSPIKGTFATRTLDDTFRLNHAAGRIQALARQRSSSALQLRQEQPATS